MALTSSSEAMPPVDLSISEAGMCAAATTNNTDALDPELAQEMVMSARVGDLDDFKSLMQLHSISLRDASLCRSLYGAQTALPHGSCQRAFDPDDENEEELSAVAESTAQLAAAHGFENVTVRFEDDSDANDVDMVASTSIER
ncbi:hypothetical protein BASA62_004279 [Batrachochytrium salamandrivorans]|nr:hypothetical protein BASA62_004279 [Batrachochytrium salamandrivorans]